MANQKWVSPAGAPATADYSATGPSGSFVYSREFGSAGDLGVGATVEMFAAGTLTTTGAPTANILISALAGNTGTDGVSIPVTASADVTDRQWRLHASFTVRASNADDTLDYAYWYSIVGLADSEVTGSGVKTNVSPSAFLYVFASWDTADSGDTISMSQAYGKWIG